MSLLGFHYKWCCSASHHHPTTTPAPDICELQAENLTKHREQRSITKWMTEMHFPWKIHTCCSQQQCFPFSLLHLSFSFSSTVVNKPISGEWIPFQCCNSAVSNLFGIVIHKSKFTWYVDIQGWLKVFWFPEPWPVTKVSCLFPGYRRK